MARIRLLDTRVDDVRAIVVYLKYKIKKDNFFYTKTQIRYFILNCKINKTFYLSASGSSTPASTTCALLLLRCVILYHEMADWNLKQDIVLWYNLSYVPEARIEDVRAKIFYLYISITFIISV